MLNTVIVSILVFGAIIFVHELGHFLAAKAANVKVLEFAIGMGPAILKKQKGETAYSLRILPIGGFVSMEGEDSESEDERSFEKASLFSRFAIIFSGALMNLILGFVIMAVMVTSAGRVATTTVAEFREGDTPTRTAGLMAGDRITEIGGTAVHIPDDLIYYLIRYEGEPTSLTVVRGGAKTVIPNVTFPYTVIDKYEATGDINDKGQSYRSYDIDFYVTAERNNVGNVLYNSFYRSVAVVKLIWQSLLDIITGKAAPTQLSGPIGVTSALGTAVKSGWSQVFYLMLLISINLGIVNLLPLPALDGGKLFLLIAEGITRRRLNPKYERYINIAGFALLMLLVLFVTYNDIMRLIFA